jgi:hypothetical protein
LADEPGILSQDSINSKVLINIDAEKNCQIACNFNNFLKMKWKILIAISALILAGCASDVANRYYSEVKYPARPYKQVEVLTNAPARPYVVIADFQGRDESAKALRKQAAKIGADAIIISYIGGAYNSRDQWAGQDSERNTYSHIIGTALKYTP